MVELGEVQLNCHGWFMLHEKSFRVHNLTVYIVYIKESSPQLTPEGLRQKC